MKKILCIVSDGFEELEAVGAIALWRRAGLEVDVTSLVSTLATGRFQLTISDLKNIDEVQVDHYDALFLPGGPHYATLEKSTQVKEIIQFFVKNDKVISAICAAPTILGRMGLLEGKNYTCYTSMNEDFKGTFTNTYVAQDGNIITGRSAAAVIDFAFVVIEELLGKTQCEKVKNEVYYYQ